MQCSEFPLTLLPSVVKDKVTFKRYKKGEYIYENGNDNIFYIKEGKGVKIRCDEDGEKIYPYMFSDDEFIGVNAYFTGETDWEVIAYTDEVTGVEIPKKIFKEYILSTPIFTQEYLPKANRLLTEGVRGFYIYSQGGAAAYFAYLLLNYFCKDNNLFHFESYTMLTKAVYVNKSTLYKITNQFIDEGLIEKYKNTIKVLDREGLLQYFSSYKY